MLGTRTRTVGRTACVLTLLLVLGACTSQGSVDPTQTDDPPPASATTEPSAVSALEELIQEAEAGGPITCYLNHTEDVVQRVVERFEAEYGIDAQCERMDGGAVGERVTQEVDAQRGIPDLITTTDSSVLVALSGRDALADLSSLPDAQTAASSFPGNFWHPNHPVIASTYLTPLYNTETVNPEDVPSDWQDLLEPRWQGRLVSGPPVGFGSGGYWLYVFEQTGDDFFEALGAQDIVVVATSTEAVGLVSAGSVDLAILSSVGAASAAIASGAPVEEVVLGDQGPFIFSTHVAVPLGSSNPAGGLLLANWLLSPDGQCALNCDGLGVASLPGVETAIEPPVPNVRYDGDYVSEHLPLVIELFDQHLS